MLLKQK